MVLYSGFFWLLALRDHDGQDQHFDCVGKLFQEVLQVLQQSFIPLQLKVKMKTFVLQTS